MDMKAAMAPTATMAMLEAPKDVAVLMEAAAKVELAIRDTELVALALINEQQLWGQRKLDL